jgi:hypothetical protein
MKKKKENLMEFINATEAPAGGAIKWSDHAGKLLVVEPVGFEAEISTSFGPKSAVRANVHVITGPTTAEVFDDVLVFPRVLQDQLRSHVGSLVVGRLGSGEAKPGQAAPHKLLEASAEDMEKAKTYWSAKSVSGLTSTASTAAEAPF